MAYHLTFLATTKLWSVTTDNIVAYPSTVNASAGGPYEVVPSQIQFDPVHKTGGTFWFLVDGPHAGYFVSSSTNSLGYGSISVTSDTAPGTPGGDIANINPLADWRILIKEMGGGDGTGTHALTFNEDTEIWSRTTGGIIKWPSTVTGVAGGPYRVNPVTVPFDPVHQTGGSFWELKEGPNVGFLVSAHSNTLGYGNITVDARVGNRGPGATLATLHHPNAHLAGFSKLYNQGGEMHFTLLVDDPNVRVPVPKQTHYAIEFEATPGEEDWVEVAAGLIWDIDATDTEVVFYGIDYLALFQFVIDERFSPDKPDLPVPNGSKYVAQTITQIVTEQLQHAVGLLDSPVGFITVGSIATMPYRVTIYSTLQPCLQFVVGLLNSHRAGTSKLTEIRVQKTGDNAYAVVVEDDPGVERPELALQYGQLAQGYKVREFDKDWASRVNMIGRDPTGRSTALQFQSVASPQSQALWGRIAGPPQFVESVDKADMKRRALQAAIDASRIGRKVGIGTKLGSYRPFEAYNLLDMVPVIIDHGGVDTGEWTNDQFVGDDPAAEDPSATSLTGLWAIIGVQWESYDDGHWITTPLLYPKGFGKIKLGDVQGAFNSSAADTAPILPHPTTPGNVLMALMVGIGNTTIFPSRFVMVDDPVPAAPESTDWTIIGEVLTDYTDQNIGGPGALSGLRVTIAWRRVFDSERTQIPMSAQAHGGGASGTSVWLYELPATIIPTAVDTLVKHVDGNPETFQFPSHAGNLFTIWAFETAAGHSGIPIPTVTVGAGVTKVTDADNLNNPSRLIDAGTLVEISSMKAGGVMSLTVTPDPMYHSLNTAAVMVKLPDGVILPSIPYPANQIDGDLTDDDLDSGSGSPPPPAVGSGYGPPTIDTPATSEYTDLLTGQKYTFDSGTGSWSPVPGTSFSDSGFYEFTFTAATTWTINHTLGGHPSVELYGTDGHEIEADIDWVSTSQIVVTFTEAVAGTATLR